MDKKRSSVEKLILKYISKIAGKRNMDMYAKTFANFTDKQFHSFMVGLRDNRLTLSVVAPQGSTNGFSIEKNIKIGKELGFDFYQHIEIKGDRGMKPYTPPNKTLITMLPIRRPSQLLIKGISVPKNSNKIDLLSGQVTGESKSGKLTMIETQMLSGMGLEESLKELHKDRAGDIGAMNAMKQILYKNGVIHEGELEPHRTGDVGSRSMGIYWKASHILPTGLVK